MNVSLITFGLSSFCFLALGTLMLAQWRVRPLGSGLLCAAGASAVWGATVAIGTLYDYPPITLIHLTELARDSSWIFFLFQLLGFQEDGNVYRWLGRPWLPKFALGVAAALFVVGLRPMGTLLPIDASVSADAAITLWLGLSILGLLLVEQVYRNASSTERWGIKFLCLGLGTMFAYDLFMYAEALLFRQLSASLWQARGLVNALVVPWLAIAIARNRNWRTNVYVSRQVVFHTVTLMGAGIYMITMAVIGYFIRILGGNWGGVLQVGFLAAAGLLLVTLLFSANLRARLRVYLSKHFFSYRYDYREEWLRFTDGLATLNTGDAGEGIIRAMSHISLSKSGALIYRDSHGNLSATATWEMQPLPHDYLGNLPEWTSQRGWVIDLREWRGSPDLYTGLHLPEWLQEDSRVWLIVPLFFQNELEGLLFLARTELKVSVNWEDRDLLKTAGRQAAALLSQQRASSALVEARQFDAFNRLSAYVIHDLKNILAQQSLMVSNAKKHRDNPAFIDDMIGTVENSVKRMQRLMEQMRSGMRTIESEELDLGALLQTVVNARSSARPSPTLHVKVNSTVVADKERLTTVFSHLIQNAQEATSDEGRVTIDLSVNNNTALVSIKDNGVGMSREFLQKKLFAPFESTKGLTGMGIGAFESREYVRQLGGDIRAESIPGEGSTFVVSIPTD